MRDSLGGKEHILFTYYETIDGVIDISQEFVTTLKVAEFSDFNRIRIIGKFLNCRYAPY